MHHDCLLNRLFRRRSTKTSTLRVTGLCAANSPGTGEFPAQMASNAENVSIWWRHHALRESIAYSWTVRVADSVGLSIYYFFNTAEGMSCTMAEPCFRWHTTIENPSYIYRTLSRADVMRSFIRHQQVALWRKESGDILGIWDRLPAGDHHSRSHPVLG